MAWVGGCVRSEVARRQQEELPVPLALEVQKFGPNQDVGVLGGAFNTVHLAV